MDLNTITYIVVGATFLLYIGIAIWARAGTTGEFYVAGKGVHPVANGMATAADWMSAASFISMAGLIAFNGYGASVFLMGWTGGYVLLALLLAPYLRKFGKFTVPEFIGERFYSQTARLVAVICLILASVTYVIGQMKGIGVAFSRFLETSYEQGLFIGMGIVFVYAVMGGMKGITYTQIAQYVVLIFAYTIPAVFISMNLTGNPIPQLGLIGEMTTGPHAGMDMMARLDQVVTDPRLRAVLRAGDGLQAEHVRVHAVADDRNRGSAARHHPFLHRSQGEGRTQLRWLGAGLHRDPLHHRAGCRLDGASEPDEYHPDGPGR